MTVLVMSDSRQRNAQTHNVKVTCPHRQKSKKGNHNAFNVSIFLVISVLSANSVLSILITQK